MESCLDRGKRLTSPTLLGILKVPEGENDPVDCHGAETGGTNMKKRIAILLAVLLLLGLAACGKQPQNNGGSDAGKETTAAPAPSGQNGENSGGENNAPQNALVTDGSRCGVLQVVKPQDKLRIIGLIIASGSGHHDYPGVEELAKQGFKTEGLNSEFYLNEWFEFYGDLEGRDSVDVIALANDPKADYAAMTPADLAAAEEKVPYSVVNATVSPEAENHGFLFSAYVNGEMEPGLYNVFFCCDGKICFLVQLNILPEPEQR